MISIRDDDEQAAETLECALLDSLRSDLPQNENARFVLTARDDDGALLGGVSASSSYGWLLVKVLWVADAHRSSGIGRSLMAAIESKARDNGCHAAWLDTSNPAAKGFYEKQGFVVFGELSNSPGQHPAGHRRWFMKKPLQP